MRNRCAPFLKSAVSAETEKEKAMSSSLRALALSCVFAATLANHAQAEAKKTLIVAEPLHGTGYLPLYVAIQKGFFEEEGLDIKVLTIESGSGHTNAVLSGQAFAFIGGPEHNAFAKLKGGELRAVVNVVDRGNSYYVALSGKEPPAGMSMPDYFKGKTIATGLFGGTPNSITRYMLKSYGLDIKKDVNVLESTTGAILAAMKTGNAQIGVLTEPVITQAIRQGISGEPIVNIPKNLGPYAYSTLNIRQESIEKDPESVRKFVRAVMRGLKATYDNPDEATAIAKKEFPTMALEDLKATLDRSFKDEIWSKDGSISPQSWETAAKVVIEAGVLKQFVPYEQIIDMKFFEASKALVN
jgi:NitT/TauT family transport system substrate-binding protein